MSYYSTLQWLLGKLGSKDWSSPNWLKSYRCTLPYPYFEFNAYFSIILVIHIFWGQTKSQNLKFFKLTEISHMGSLLYAMLLRFYCLYFQNFCHWYFFGLICSQNLKFSKLNQIWYRDALLYAYYNFNVYFSKIFVTRVFSEKFGTKIWSFLKWLKFWTGIHCWMLFTILMFIFS